MRQALETLPPPTPEAQAHSDKLCARLREDMAAAGGVLSFEQFMERALYAPGLGYYSAGARKFGAAGDFVTAPELSPLFGRCLAVQCGELLTALGGGELLELGAGSGALAADLLQELERRQQLPERYWILEVSGELRARQQRKLGERVPALLSRVEWLDRLPAAFSGVILGNEVLDALPVSRFRRSAAGFEECMVGTEDGGFAWRRQPAGAELQAALWALESQLPEPLVEGYCSEICLRLPAFIFSLADALTRGALLLVDYGYPRAAYYHPERSMGTLMCHYRQRAHSDPFLYPGLQDITAHVDFTAVAEAATHAGLELAGYTSQAQFLLALGIAELAHDWRTSREVKLLTLPEEMGERFQVMGFSKQLEPAWRGFSLRDLSHSL